MHWSDKYVNQPYVPETGDCAAFAERVAREHLGIVVGLPDGHAVGLREQAAQIVAHRGVFAEVVAGPIEGHPVLLRSRGDLFHIGVMCLLAHEWWVVHADKGFGAVVRQPLRRMLAVDYKLEGFYRWKA
jgi:hypothetical protein